MAIIKEVREKLNKGQNIFRRVTVELLIEEYSFMQRMVEDMRTQYNNEFLPELETAKQKIQSLETDLIQARRVVDAKQEIIKDLSIALHFYAEKSNWHGAFDDIFCTDQGYEKATKALIKVNPKWQKTLG